MKTLSDQLLAQHERIESAGNTASGAVQDLARAANGMNSHIIPAPTAYDVLGNIKVLLSHLQEVTDFMPSGLTASLEDPRILVRDRHYMTGDERDPAQQVALATAELRALSAVLAAAESLAEAAQEALSSQSYAENDPHG